VIESAPHRAELASPLRVSGLCKRFDERSVLEGVDLVLGHGESVALVGANGSGKSTLLRCCLGLIAPDEGSVVLLGESLSWLRGKRLRRLRGRTGIIWQRHNLVPRLSALANVVHGAQCASDDPRLWFRSTAPERVRAEARAALAAVGLGALAGQRADKLSGGESQRVAIARALMQRPALIFADEPVASLDPRVGEEVMSLLVREARRRSAALLFVSHDLRLALEHADRVVGLRRGRIELDAPSERLGLSALRAFYD
jgi:phosphonate transport system ATP-binding protein